MSGSFWATQDFDPVPGVYSLSPFGATDVFVLKLDRGPVDSFGSNKWEGVTKILEYQLWQMPPAMFISLEIFGALQILILVPGIYNLVINDSISNIFISKLDQNGNFLLGQTS